MLNPQRFGDRHHLVHVGFGLDGPMRIELGYAHTGEAQPVGPLAIGLRLSMPLMPDLGDLELSGLVQGGLISAAGWGLSPRLELAVRTASTVVAGVTDLGVRANLTAGYLGERAMVVAEGSWEQALVAYIRPSDHYLQAYPDARAGLYAGGGGFFRAGLAAGVRLFAISERGRAERAAPAQAPGRAVRFRGLQPGAATGWGGPPCPCSSSPEPTDPGTGERTGEVTEPQKRMLFRDRGGGAAGRFRRLE